MKDEEIDLELGLPDDVLKEKYEGQLQREMKGPLYEVVSRIMKTLVKKKITVPGSFIGHSGTSAVSCAFKSASGLLYPLEKGFMFINKPPMHIRQEEVACVNFARSDVSTRTFDFEIETKIGNSFTFTSIEKEVYGKLFDYVNSKKIRIKNVGKKTESSTKDNFFQESDDDETDHYAEKLKRDAKEEEEGDEEEDESSEDSDYNPDKDKVRGSEPDEEFDSDAASGSSDDNSSKSGSDAKSKSKPKQSVKLPSKPSIAKRRDNSSSDKEMKSDGSSEGSDEEDEKEKKKPPIPSKSKATTKPVQKVERKKSEKSSKKKDKDPNKPKKAQTSYMIWLNENRNNIKTPGMAVTDVMRRAGVLWKEMKDKSKWEQLANEDKKRYAKQIEEYRKNGGGAVSLSKPKAGTASKSNPVSKSNSASKSNPASKSNVVSKSTEKQGASKKSPAKSSEFVATEESSSDDEKSKKESDEEEEAGSASVSGGNKSESD